ncbi:hypothetical protein [Providencia manganoxydans]|uniref:hypothetical protein n=1 Tax=Providencia manganoxydans TaxID=2923283 RepID=UPI0034E58E7F
MTQFTAKRAAYEQAKRAVQQKDYDIQQVKQRKRDTISAAESYDETWRLRFQESGGVITDEMKQLRTDSVLSKDTLNEFDKLITLYQDELKILEGQLGKAAQSLIHQQGALIRCHANALLTQFMQAHGAQLNRIMKLYYLSLCVNESGDAGATGVHEGINDAKTQFDEFIKTQLTRNWYTPLTATENKSLSSEVDFLLDDDVYFDKNLKRSLWAEKRQKHAAEEK